MPKSADPLTPAEWKIMKIVWRLERCAARDVYEAAGEAHGMAPSTVKTHLRRLCDKGYLAATRIGNSFLYRPRRPALGSLFAAADRLLEHTLEGTKAPLLAYMLEKSRMTEDELRALREVLDRHPNSAAPERS
jgi:predicted transcriptional regulator